MIVASLLVALSASSAAADTARPAPAPAQPSDATLMSTSDCARARAAKKTCVINIEGIDIEGNKMDPDGIRVDLLGFKGLGSLITLRRDFIKEIIRSAEDL